MLTIDFAITHIGTACTLLKIGPFVLLTDPVFDPASHEHYRFGPPLTPSYWAHSQKNSPPAITLEDFKKEYPHIDAILLSHDHHADNLDYNGRELLITDAIKSVITTPSAKRRLDQPLKRDRNGRLSIGKGLGLSHKTTALAPWSKTLLASPDGFELTIWAIPAQHGPDHDYLFSKADQTTGFLLTWFNPDSRALYISGDTVLTDTLRALPKTLQDEPFQLTRLDYIILHGGGVIFPNLPLFGDPGDFFTMNTSQFTEFMELLSVLDPRSIFPIHFEGWTHFRESVDAFKSAVNATPTGTKSVKWLTPGVSFKSD